MAIRYQDENGNWVTGQKAIETKLTDQQGNFNSDNVEGALRELAEGVKSNADVTKLSAQVEANANNISELKPTIAAIKTDLSSAQEDIEWLKVNGGGGGGSAVPTITSTFTDTAIDKGTDVVIPIFFSSPNMGAGTAYILVNNIQVDTAGVSQGNNSVRVYARYLTATENQVAIYVRDRAGIVSNQLSWNVIAGGIDLTSTFDYEADYGITDSIRIPYTIDTGITSSDIIMTMTVDGTATEHKSTNGLNYLDLQASNLGLGTHAVTMIATVGKYTSKQLNFNIVIVSTTELYLSSTFINDSEFTYGVPIGVNYRLSKQSTEEFTVYLKVDGVTQRTQKLTVGSYYWTIQSLPVGPHTITIQAISLDYSENKSIDLTLSIVQGEYTPVEPVTLGLICDLNAVGKSNNDENKEIWVDESGNGHDAQLVNFNFGTNGYVNDTLVCDNDAYVVIPWSPWEENAINGSTIDIIYEPINSGVEDCRVLDYTMITDELSTEEIKPFKGVFADILRSIPSSASSGTEAGQVNLDDQSGEIHLTWVLDRTNKFMKTYLNGTLCRIMFLTDSGSGVNKFYEDFSLDSYIYLNSTKGLNCGTNNIKRFRVYDHALTSDEVLMNHIANITDLEQQEIEYNFNYKNTTLPKMYLTGDITNMTPTQTVPMKIEYMSTDEEKYGQSFNTGIENNPVCIQGTSSLQYVRHNYTIYLKDEYGSDMKYNPYGEGSVPSSTFCLKADYVESSHANNTGIAKFVNDCLYDTKTPAQLENENCRTAINGFPIEVYMNGEYLGVYNLNYDRYSYEPYGYDYTKNPNMLVYEINSNSNTSAGAFYRYGANPESSAGITELEYYKRDFSLIYGNRTSDGDTYSEIKSLVEWVSVAEQDLFRETIGEHFNREYLFRYFLCVLFIGAVDSLGKNLKINTWDGKIWYPTFYDLDTCLGIDNSGYLTIPPDVEIESGSYNTSNSNLWSKVWNYFRTELQEEWKTMRQGRFTLDNIMSYVEGQQIDTIPAKLFNDDAQVKYLDFGSLYTYCCHGNKKHQMKRWLRERIAYVDSMLGFFTSQDDQITIRMNKTGNVSFEVTPYIPLYFSVKWSNATGGTQTFKLKRGETKTFYYTSTTSTDQEVIIYHAQYIKNLDNLSNLNPSSCILSNATKLTNVEIHSSELYNINVTNNKYLRKIDLENCTALGTVTATGSSLNLSNCKYLKYCNIYNTNLTEVQLDTSGGSLVEIYYPKTVQSISLIKQRLLEIIGLPIGNETPTALYTINIQECPSITKLNTSNDPEIASSFASMVYCNNLTIRNSLDLAELNFDGFHRLQNVVIENMYNLEQIGFQNLLPVGETSTIKYIGMSNCPKLSEIELNCTSDDYEITFADKAILNFGGLLSLKSISSNSVLKGIETIVVPRGLESMYFTIDYGTGYSSIKNIWVSSQCDVSTVGTTPKVTHVDGVYTGIDFKDMNLKNIDLGALVNIPRAINFSLSPTTVNPNFNKNRDGDTYPYLQPEGTLDLTNYTESLARFFDGVNLDKLQIICNGDLPQADLSYCFYNSSFSSLNAITILLGRVASITNLDYCFYRTTIDSIDVLSEINMGSNSTMNYTFAECPNITSLSGVVISRNVVGVEGMFSGCPLTDITNMTVNVAGSISGLFKGCAKLATINNLRVPNVTDVSRTFDGCTNLSSLQGFQLPDSCTNVTNLFNGCYNLTSLAMNFGPNITSADNWYPPYLETLHGTTIENDYVKLTNCNTLKNIHNLNLIVGNVENFLEGVGELKNINGFDVRGTVTSVANLFKNQNLTTATNIVFGPTITDFTSCFENCQGMKNSTLVSIEGIRDHAVNFSYMFKNCLGFTQVVDTEYVDGGTNCTGMYEGCDNITAIRNLTIHSTVLDSMFKNCTKLAVVENLSITRATSMKAMFMNDVAITNIAITVPDTCTSMNELLSGCSSLTDISGSTFGSKVTSATDWIKGCPNLVKANDITSKNSLSLFNGCSSLIECKNLRLEGQSGYSFFYNCKKLSDVSGLIITDKVTSINNMFRGCSSLKEIDFSNCDLSNITTMSDLIREILTGVTVRNIKLGDKLTLVGMERVFYTMNTNIDGIYIPNNFVAQNIFTHMGWNAAIKSITNITFSKSVTDITGICQGRSNLLNDFEIPSHVTNCTNAFSGCTKMTHVHSNWNNTYDNDITATDCYAGCTAITHVDNVALTINEYISALDEVPITWGGYGFTRATTGIYKIVTPSDNYQWYANIGVNGGLLGNQIVNWGDGSVTTGTSSHTYEKAGTYIIKGNIFGHNGVNWGIPGQVITEIHQLPSSVNFSGGSNDYCNFINLEYLNLSGAKFIRASSFFKNCPKLTTIVGVENADFSQCTEFTYTFTGCPITSINVTNMVTSSVTSIRGLFQNCNNLVNIIGLETWDVTNVTTMGDLFYNCNNLVNIIGLETWDVTNVTSIGGLFYNCNNLVNIIGLETWDVTNVTTMGNLFYNCSSLTGTLDLSMWTTSSGCYMGYFAWGIGCTEIKMPRKFSSVYQAFRYNSIERLYNFDMSYIDGASQWAYCAFQASSITYIEFKGTLNYDLPKEAFLKDLEIESLLLLLNCLCDNTASGEIRTVVIGSNNIAKLSPAQIKIATDKGWTVV